MVIHCANIFETLNTTFSNKNAHAIKGNAEQDFGHPHELGHSPSDFEDYSGSVVYNGPILEAIFGRLVTNFEMLAGCSP